MRPSANYVQILHLREVHLRETAANTQTHATKQKRNESHVFDHFMKLLIHSAYTRGRTQRAMFLSRSMWYNLSIDVRLVHGISTIWAASDGRSTFRTRDNPPRCMRTWGSMDASAQPHAYHQFMWSRRQCTCLPISFSVSSEAGLAFRNCTFRCFNLLFKVERNEDVFGGLLVLPICFVNQHHCLLARNVLRHA